MKTIYKSTLFTSQKILKIMHHILYKTQSGSTDKSENLGRYFLLKLLWRTQKWTVNEFPACI